MKELRAAAARAHVARKEKARHANPGLGVFLSDPVTHSGWHLEADPRLSTALGRFAARQCWVAEVLFGHKWLSSASPTPGGLQSPRQQPAKEEGLRADSNTSQDT